MPHGFSRLTLEGWVSILTAERNQQVGKSGPRQLVAREPSRQRGYPGRDGSSRPFGLVAFHERDHGIEPIRVLTHPSPSHVLSSQRSPRILDTTTIRTVPRGMQSHDTQGSARRQDSVSLPLQPSDRAIGTMP